MKTTMAGNKAGTSSVQTIGYLTSILLVFIFVLPAEAKIQVDLFGVASSEEPKIADQVLRDYLQDKVPNLEIIWEDTEGYKPVLEKLISPGKNPFLARTTPYVFVLAEMLGAKMEVLALYKSKTTKTTTYNTYFVVNRMDFEYLNHAPSLSDLGEFLKRKSIEKNPCEFIYHDQFSTSSYFLPSLYFRDHGIYSMDSTSSELIGIKSRAIEMDKPSSTPLVKAVAGSKGVFAAVWDGTKAKFEPGGKYYQEYGGKVYFIKVPTMLPNDLLVSASSLNDTKEIRDIIDAIKNMTNIELQRYAGKRDLDDYDSWIYIRAMLDEQGDQARFARPALNDLRRLARTRSRAIIVKIEEDSKDPTSPYHLDAARQAVRLSGTELTVYDSSYENADITWTLRKIHDEAIVLTSQIKKFGVKDQIFQISYKKDDPKDLTKRIGDLIQSRMHRIRSIWPNQYKTIILRDTPFPIEPEIQIQKIKWTNPEKNAYSYVDKFNGEITNGKDFYKIELKGFGAEWKKMEEDLNDPMSNISYRVVLKRPEEENKILTVLTGAYVVLMVFSAAGAVYDFKRKA